MKYTNEFIQIGKQTVKQININTARKNWENGNTIFMHPCNLRLNNHWQNPFKFVPIEHLDLNFDILSNEVETYNCDNERGNYLNFFIEI